MSIVVRVISTMGDNNFANLSGLNVKSPVRENKKPSLKFRFAIFLIQSLVAGYTFGYVAFFLAYIFATYYKFYEGLWVIVAFISAFHIFSSTARNLCQVSNESVIKLNQRSMLIASLILSAVLASLGAANSNVHWIMHVVFYGFFGGLYTSIINAALEENSTKFLSKLPNYYHHLSQFAKSVSMCLVPHTAVGIIGLCTDLKQNKPCYAITVFPVLLFITIGCFIKFRVFDNPYVYSNVVALEPFRRSETEEDEEGLRELLENCVPNNVSDEGTLCSKFIPNIPKDPKELLPTISDEDTLCSKFIPNIPKDPRELLPNTVNSEDTLCSKFIPNIPKDPSELLPTVNSEDTLCSKFIPNIPKDPSELLLTVNSEDTLCSKLIPNISSDSISVMYAANTLEQKSSTASCGDPKVETGISTSTDPTRSSLSSDNTKDDAVEDASEYSPIPEPSDMDENEKGMAASFAEMIKVIGEMIPEYPKEERLSTIGALFKVLLCYVVFKVKSIKCNRLLLPVMDKRIIPFMISKSILSITPFLIILIVPFRESDDNDKKDDGMMDYVSPIALAGFLWMLVVLSTMSIFTNISYANFRIIFLFGLFACIVSFFTWWKLLTGTSSVMISILFGIGHAMVKYSETRVYRKLFYTDDWGRLQHLSDSFTGYSVIVIYAVLYLLINFLKLNYKFIFQFATCSYIVILVMWSLIFTPKIFNLHHRFDIQ